MIGRYNETICVGYIACATPITRVRQLSSALKYLHNRTPWIRHCDVKPENILVVERGVDGIYVKFGDFGLSKAADTLKTFCGTRRG